MKLRHLFTLNLVFALYFGLSGSLFPRVWLLPYGLAPGGSALWAVRLAGGSLLGFATLMWFGRANASRDARRAIALALLVQDLIGAFACLELQRSGLVNALGWSNTLGYLLLALGYAYFLFVRAAES